jgi:hypothetical protein
VSNAEILERESRWALPVALVTMLAVILFVGSTIIATTTISADGEADLLREVNANEGAYLVSGILRALGSLLLFAPLLYLFRAAEARNPAVRSQLIGVIWVTPLFMAAGAIFSSLASLDAASEFVSAGIEGSGERADDEATDLIREASLRNVASGLSLAGALGFAFIMVYTCLQAMRVGLLSRFWGSLGMALGAVSFILVQFMPFVLLWFVYFGLLVAGWVPGGRPPAWAEGKAVPWPTPGEEAAERLEQEQPEEEAGEPASPWDDNGRERPNPPRQRGERKKRKRRE